MCMYVRVSVQSVILDVCVWPMCGQFMRYYPSLVALYFVYRSLWYLSDTLQVVDPVNTL